MNVDRPQTRSRVIVLAAALAAFPAACSTDTKPPASAAGTAAPADIRTPAADGLTSTTALAPGSLVLSPDGLGPLTFGTQAAQALKGLTQALGRAETWRSIPGGTGCAATRVFTWKNLDVVVNEATAASGSLRGLVGWTVRSAEPALGLTTDQGIGIGATVADVREAYGDSVTIIHAGTGASLTISASGGGVITADVAGTGDRSRVQTLRAGTVCQ